MTVTRTPQKFPCKICGKSFRLSELLPAELLHGKLNDKICAQHPDWTADCYICQEDLNRYRREFIEQDLTDGTGELNALQQEVVQSIQENESIISNINDEFTSKLSFGDRLADKVAEFGGSWKFIIIFAVVLFVWITENSLAVFIKFRFDGTPFILLNLVLSCVAAIQAPVIMMSQNRQEAKDRMRSEQDFKTNLKAELEVRNLNAKIDELLTHQWQRLLEIQQIQVEMIEQMTTHHQWEKELHTGKVATAEKAPAASGE